VRCCLAVERKWVALLGLALISCSQAAIAQLQQELSAELVRHTLVLRNFYTGHKLRVGSDGALLLGGTPALGPTDGRIYVEAVQLEADRLIIRGERPISIFDPGTGDAKLLSLHARVEIDAQLLSDHPQENDVRALLDRIFFTPSEADAFTCPTDEAQAFRERMLRFKETVSAKQDKPSAKEKGLHQLCFPGGTRGYFAGGEVQPPKPLKTPDPGYPPSMAGKRERKTVVLAVIVNETGKLSSFVVIGTEATMFDLAAIDAVQHWKFLPASYQGKPIAAAINVEVNFFPR
jgi:TonB family protein